MFNRKVEITIMTRCKNEDNFKVMRLINRLSKVGTILVNCNKSDDVEIKFITKKSNVKRLTEDLELLKIGNIKAEMEIV